MQTDAHRDLYRALVARDARFDGRFFVGVSTTGVYCRPICPARTPRADRCRFFTRPAEAEQAGFRACFRCRPELAPGSAPVDSVPRLVATALARIDAGFLNEGSVDELAASLGVTARHLRRTMESVLAVSPIDVAQTRRLALAKQLLQDTALPITEVAYASGFASLRRFQAAFAERFGAAPTVVRRKHASASSTDDVVIRLECRAPFDWGQLLGFLGPRAIPGVERIEEGVYARAVALRSHGVEGMICATRAPDRLKGPGIELSLTTSLLPALSVIVPRVRALFDLDAHPTEISRVLGADPLLAPSVTAIPGLRVAGAFDGFELAVRAILGQQVSVRGATTLAHRLVERLGEPLKKHPRWSAFPTPEKIARAGASAIREIGMPTNRAAAIVGLADAVAAGKLRLDPSADVPATVAALEELPGVGPWTAQYIAMRALRSPDAFPSGDLVVQRMLDAKTSKKAEARAAPWSPWRAYAVLHLWSLASRKALS
jgi:AraC family transcriptional regulator of adaptative response / DNA-3-methyladenine glycosylase II